VNGALEITLVKYAFFFRYLSFIYFFFSSTFLILPPASLSSYLLVSAANYAATPSAKLIISSSSSSSSPSSLSRSLFSSKSKSPVYIWLVEDTVGLFLHA
jgi:hypothetical protein